MKPKIFLSLLITGIIFIFSCKAKLVTVASEERVCITDSLSKNIIIDTATFSTVGDVLKLSGEIGFDDKKISKVYPFSSGQVIKVNVSTGDKVSKGQILAIIKSADVSGNYSDLSSANSEVTIAKRQMENQQSLYQNGIASEREYEEARENYQKALAAANKMKSQIQINGNGKTTSKGTYIVTAPIGGYILEKKISQGNFIRSDAGDNLFTVGDISDVWVWANVYETDISKVKVGYTATVTTLAYPGNTFYGTVDEVGNILDPVTKVMRIRIKLPNDKGMLKPQMFSNIVITNKESVKAVAVFSNAIISENGKDYVVKYNGKCDLKVQEVGILKTVGDKTYIKSGLLEGEKVIAKNQILLFRALSER